MAHAAIITTAFTLIGRDRQSQIPANHLTVSLSSGLPEIRPLPRDQKKLTKHSTAVLTQNTSVSNPSDYGTAFKDKTTSENRRDESHIISTAQEKNAEISDPIKSGFAAIGLPLHLQARGVSSSSLPTGQQSLPVGVTESGGLVHDKSKTQADNKSTQDVTLAIRKAIEKALIYPLFAKKRGLEGTALTEFTVNAKGYPEDIRIIVSSGYAILDTAAKQSLSKAAPFNAGKGRYEIPITFTLKKD
jgi:periplasmic protein TonB